MKGLRKLLGLEHTYIYIYISNCPAGEFRHRACGQGRVPTSTQLLWNAVPPQARDTFPPKFRTNERTNEERTNDHATEKQPKNDPINPPKIHKKSTQNWWISRKIRQIDFLELRGPSWAPGPPKEQKGSKKWLRGPPLGGPMGYQNRPQSL